MAEIFNSELNSLLSFSSRSKTPVIMQAEMAECGIACLAMVASFYGHQLDLSSIRRRLSPNLKGTSLKQLIELAGELNLNSRPMKCVIDEVHMLATPCILHWGMSHFVVLTKVSKNHLVINDPALGKRKISFSEFSEQYTGIALELSPSHDFVTKDERERMKLSQLWHKIIGLKRTLCSLFALSILLQAFSLLTPYYMQWIIDEVLVSQDIPLLVVLALGFGFMMILNSLITAFRSWLILRVSSLMSLQMGANLLRHIFRLPMSFFENRHIGDLVSRFSSLTQIKERLTTGLVETFVDGIMGISILLMMLLYSAKLTLIVVFSLLLYVILRIVMYQPLYLATEKSIEATAKEQTNFLENIRAMQPIKLFTREFQRQGIWQNHYANVINAEIKLGKLTISFDLLKSWIFGLENIIVIFFAASLVISGELSAGMLIAFIAYKEQVISRISNFIEQIIQFRMLRLYLDRLSDITLHDQEKNLDRKFYLDNVRGELVLENISFSYQKDEHIILDNISLTIKAGECVALTGGSGCGKTTLMKLMLGILSPTQGRILLDGHDITQIGLREYRARTAAIMQNDTLLSGSVADNISFFSPEPDYIKIKESARLAAIDQDIERINMGYHSLVGDMGNQFSGGQAQRLLLARALYQSPSLLFMDEATSHLDIENEFIISHHIKNLSMTRIMIAHRPETINHADKVFVLEDGKLSER